MRARRRWHADAQQLQALGVDPRPVTDLALTHLDVDHVGGIADFPWAKVHLSATQLSLITPALRRDCWTDCTPLSGTTALAGRRTCCPRRTPGGRRPGSPTGSGWLPWTAT
ncbi:MBL fold metallo-hydrolase [Naumannella sp. ID2617S]|nr:MBL fold metallo-hydrolase [Naumannella sp. ID2617S]